MGQVTLGLLYGCEAPPVETTEEEFWYDLAEGFNKEVVGPYDWRKPTPRVRHETEGGKELIGVWVAVGGCGEDGVPYLTEKAMPLDQIAEAFRESVAQAENLWFQFMDHCHKKYGIFLPNPALWLTPCEVA